MNHNPDLSVAIGRIAEACRRLEGAHVVIDNDPASRMPAAMEPAAAVEASP